MTHVTRIETPEQLDAVMGHGQDLASVRKVAADFSTPAMRWEVKELNGGLYLEAKVPFVYMRVPTSRDFDVTCEYTIYVEAQPRYSDRGRWLAKLDWTGGSTLNDKDLWPRYYFNLRMALSEIQSWCLARADIREGYAERARKAVP